MTHPYEVSYETELWNQTRELALALPTAPDGPSLYVRRLLLGSTLNDGGAAVLYANTEWTDRQHTTVGFRGLTLTGESEKIQGLFGDIKEAMGKVWPYPETPDVAEDNAPLRSPNTTRQAELARFFLPTMLSLHVTIPNSIDKPFPRSRWYHYSGGVREADAQELEYLTEANRQLGQLVQGEPVYFTVEDASIMGRLVLEPDEADVYDQPDFKWAPYL